MPKSAKVELRKVSDACMKRKEERKAKEEALETGSHLPLGVNKNIQKQQSAMRGG